MHVEFDKMKSFLSALNFLHFCVWVGDRDLNQGAHTCWECIPPLNYMPIPILAHYFNHSFHLLNYYFCHVVKGLV